MTLQFHNEHGELIEQDEVAELFETDRVSMATDTIGDYWVSTQVNPLAQERERWFETAIFAIENGMTGRQLCNNYAETRTEALMNHKDALVHLQKFIDHGIDFAGLMDYANGDRPDMPKMPGVSNETKG